MGQLWTVPFSGLTETSSLASWAQSPVVVHSSPPDSTNELGSTSWPEASVAVRAKVEVLKTSIAFGSAT